MIRTAIDWLAFSSLLVAAVAGILSAASSLALGAPLALPLLGVVMAGALLVYNVDRLRDLPRDRITAPERSAFVEAHVTSIRALTLAAALVSALAGVQLGPKPALLLAPVLLLGLFHRRVKRLPNLKALYITLAWTVVVVGLPALQSGANREFGWVAAIFALAILANAVAFNIRDREAEFGSHGRRHTLWAARGVAGLGVLVAAASPAGVRPLVAIPALTLIALIPFRTGERYGAIIVDGALVLGGAVAIAGLIAID